MTQVARDLYTIEVHVFTYILQLHVLLAFKSHNYIVCICIYIQLTNLFVTAEFRL
jgi:hypothetical protein